MSGASLNRSGLKAAGPSGLTAFPSEESPEASERYEGLSTEIEVVAND